MFPRGPGEFHWRADLYLACWSQKMLRSVLSDGERAARVTTDIHPAVNGSLSCSKYCFILLWNPLKDITVSFPQQTIEAAKQKWWYDSSFTCRCFFFFFYILRCVCLREAEWQHGESPQRSDGRGDGVGRRGNGGDPVGQRALLRVHEPTQLLPQKLRYRTQVSLMLPCPCQTGTTSLSCDEERQRLFTSPWSWRRQRGNGCIHRWLVALVCGHQQVPPCWPTQHICSNDATHWHPKNVTWFGIHFVSAVEGEVTDKGAQESWRIWAADSASPHPCALLFVIRVFWDVQYWCRMVIEASLRCYLWDAS